LIRLAAPLLEKAMKIKIKRVHDPVEDDGVRVLVDRLWPRGMSKERVRADLWLKDAAPSTALRQWFGHAPARWEEFKRRYFSELDARPDVVARLLELGNHDTLTLLFSARDRDRNQAVALKEYLEKQPQ